MLSLWRCQLRQINPESINIVTSILGGRRWYDIWRIRWSPTRYWRSLQLMHCVLWRAVLLMANWWHLMCINYWIIQLRRHRYHCWLQLVALWVSVLSIKAPVITRSEMWRSGWLLTNRGQLRWIDDWIIKWMRHMYHRWIQLISLWVDFLWLNHRLSRGVVRCLPWFLPVPLLWRLPIPFGRGTMNAI